MLSEQEADRIVLATKVIGQQIVWLREHESRQNHRFRVSVYAPEDPDLRLALVGQWQPRNWGFVLLGPRNEQLRKVSDPDHPHKDRMTREVIDGRHKHIWVGTSWRRDYYFPDDIRWDDPNDVLADFLVECNITLLGDFPARPLFRKELEHGL